MHNRFKYLLVILFLTISMLFNMNYTKADSGFDSSYDSGSSWDSGDSYSSSDYSSSSDYGYSSSGSYSGGSYHYNYGYNGFWYVVSCYILGIIGYKSMKKNKNTSKDLYLTIYVVFCLVLGNLLYGSHIIMTGIAVGYLSIFVIFIPYLLKAYLINQIEINLKIKMIILLIVVNLMI